MKKEELEKIIDEELQHWNFKSQAERDIKNCIFNKIIPEVIVGIFPEEEDDYTNNEYSAWYNRCLTNIKQKAKDLYDVEL